MTGPPSSIGTIASIGTGSRVLDDLAEVIGEVAAMELAWEFRGQRLYVPQDPDREPRLAEAIGAEAARHFCEAFWRTTIAMPMQAVLDHRVRKLAAQGDLTRSEIARRCCIRVARVYSILAKVRDDRQLSLL